MMKKLIALLLCLSMALTFTACRIVIDGEENLSPSKAAASGTIGLSVSTLNNPFFVTLVEGAEKEAVAQGLNLSVVDAGDDVTKQVSDVEDLVSKGISVLIINPVDSDAVTGAVEYAMSKGVRVIAVDRAVNGVTIDCQIASDNVLGAELATQYIVDTLGAVEAIYGAGKNILVMGFDATDDAIAAIKEGRMAGTIAQQPALIGSTAVDNAVKLIGGEGIAPNVPVEVTLITAANAG